MRHHLPSLVPATRPDPPDQQDEFAQALLGAIANGLIAIDPFGDIVVWNAAAERLLGWRAPDALGRTLVDLNLDTLDAVTHEVSGARREPPLERELRVRRENGEFVDVLVTVSSMVSADGAATGVVIAMSDLSRRLEAEQQLRSMQDRLQLLVRYSADMVALVDRVGTVQFVSTAIAERVGFVVQDVEGRNAFDFVHPDDEARARAALAEILANDQATCSLVFRLRTNTGDYKWMEGRAVNLLKEPNVRAVLVALHDVTERVALESQLAHQATHDALTGLPNRTLFVDRLDHHVEHARRHGLTVAVFFWDVDEFKMVNDVAGHAVGDWVLIEVARRATNVLRSEDSVARLGGDEFVACAEVENEAQASVLAERLLESLVVDLTLSHGQQMSVTPSVGVACGAAVAADRLLVEADRAMYEAKRRGGHAMSVCRVVE